MKFIIIILFVSLFGSIYILEAEQNITGRVFSKTTGEAIAGASIRIPNTNKGTYSSTKGFFKINTNFTVKELKVSSIGYENSTIKIDSKDTLFIYLTESSVRKSNVTVTGNIEPNEVIKRAIERKRDNIEKLRTFRGSLYSKLNIGLDGNIFASAGGNSVSVGTSVGGGEKSDQFKLFLLETFSETYVDYQEKKSSSKILQRRQTSNLSPNDNIMALGNFISFYDNEINLVRTKIETPLSDDALSYYNFKINDKQIYDNKYVYVIEVIPATRLFPVFTGTIKILEDSYNLVEADLKPSETTAIPFIDDIRIRQRYSESTENIWYPSYLEITGKANVEAVKGILELKANVTATSIYSDVEINIALPDTLFNEDNKRLVTVARDADSAKNEFWVDNSLREITPEEESIYNKIDSIIVSDSIVKTEEVKSFNWTWMPHIDFNRVGSLTAGLTLGFNYHNFAANGTAAYSFGLKDILWDAELSYDIELSHSSKIEFGVGAFSELATMSLDRSYSRLFNSIFAALFHFDYYDYIKSTGWKIFANGDHGIFEYQAGVEFVNQTPESKNTNQSIFSKSIWRINPEIESAEHITAYLNGSIGNVNYFVPSEKFESQLEFWSLFGFEPENHENFYSAIGKFRTSFPIIPTGYAPVKLDLIFEGGITSINIPVQYMHRMQSSMLFIGKPGNFISSEPAIFGGREYFAGHAFLNTTDYWWRMIGLPLYEGRGINLILAGSFGRFFRSGNSHYLETKEDYYGEIGFGLTRIPTFISNVIYLSFDARWGIGPIAGGNFGWTISASLPF